MPRQFQLLIKPASADCNAACKYCFYGRVAEEGMYPDQNQHRMPHNVLEKMTADLMSHRFPSTIFCWQGGEPTLMGLDFFKYAVQLQQRYGLPGQQVGNAFQTNGVLIDEEWARFFAQYQFLVGLSIDGPEDVHNMYRINRAGRGIWKDVMRAAELCRKHNVSFNILSVVSKANENRARDVYQWMVEQNFEFLQFIPCIETHPETGQIAPFSTSPEGYGRFLCELFDIWWETKGYQTVSIRTFDAILNYHVLGRAGMCIFGPSCDVYLVVEHNGDVYPCDFFVRPDLKLGNLLDHPLETFFANPVHRQFACSKVNRVHPECHDCKWWSICHAGCQKDRIDADGFDKRRTYFCESYKQFFEHTESRFKILRDDVLRRRQPQPVVPPGTKVGRNDPCPCGSGRKFKHCCGRR